MKIGIVVNSRLRQKRALEGLEQLQNEHQVELRNTERQGHATELAAELLDQVDVLLALGGDGTFHEILQAFVNRTHLHQEKVRVGFIPAGSANDFSRNLKIPKNIAEAHQNINDEGIKVELGLITLNNDRKYFLNIADFGIGAEVVRRVNKGPKYLSPSLSFLRATSLAFLRYKPYEVKLSWENGSWTGRIAAIAVANGKTFGSGLHIAPDAVIDDGTLRITRIEDLSLGDYVINVLKLKKPKRVEHPKIHYSEADWLEVEPLDPRCALEADGEYIGKGKARFEILHRALTLIARK